MRHAVRYRRKPDRVQLGRVLGGHYFMRNGMVMVDSTGETVCHNIGRIQNDSGDVFRWGMRPEKGETAVMVSGMPVADFRTGERLFVSSRYVNTDGAME